MLGCPAYDPPSVIKDSRLVLINRSSHPIQYLCCCDTVGGHNFSRRSATIGSGNLLSPSDSVVIPGWISWDNAIQECPSKKLNIYLYTVGIKNREDYKAISEMHAWERIEEQNTFSNHFQYSLAELDSVGWRIIKK
jgi:hypothetical protein